MDEPCNAENSQRQLVVVNTDENNMFRVLHSAHVEHNVAVNRAADVSTPRNQEQCVHESADASIDESALRDEGIDGRRRSSDGVESDIVETRKTKVLNAIRENS
ncbi:unnamed protein product [Urochloa humidicola]